MEHREKGRLSCCHVTCQKSGIPEIPQYRYLDNLKALALDQPIRNAALDYAYAIAPDIIISREAFDDETILSFQVRLPQPFVSRAASRAPDASPSFYYRR